ncbi:hypothetical protein SNEBB_008674 [Seison nebaliae]|nr:hypothetical protein SNEBB_008674 [Seison nebaliae]
MLPRFSFFLLLLVISWAHSFIVEQSLTRTKYVNDVGWQFISNLSSPDNGLIGQVGGIAIHPLTSELVVFHRSGRDFKTKLFNKDKVYVGPDKPIKDATILRFNPLTNSIKKFGENFFYLPHGLRVDEKGNYWMTDVALHQIFKFDRNFQLQLTLGEKFVPGKDDDHFCQPADIAISEKGNIYVADGYCNKRIVVFDSTGTLIQVVNLEDFPQVKSINVVHSIILLDDYDVICAANREKGQIICLSLENGKIGNVIKLFSHSNMKTVYSIAYDKEINGIHAVSAMTRNEPAHGFTFYLDGSETNEWADDYHQLYMPHAITVGDNGLIYVGQIYPNNVIRFRPEMTKFSQSKFQSTENEDFSFY